MSLEISGNSLEISGNSLEISGNSLENSGNSLENSGKVPRKIGIKPKAISVRDCFENGNARQENAHRPTNIFNLHFTKCHGANAELGEIH